jgi:cell division protein ZapA (FtsZ GTPase activity inhibitor)
MKLEKKHYKVQVGGIAYMLISDESEEFVQKAASLVDEAIRDIVQGSGNGKDLRQVATLAALRFASRSLVLEEQMGELEARGNRLIEQIENSMLMAE